MGVDDPGAGYTSLQSLGSSDQESSGSECPITCPKHTASERPGLCPQWPRPPLPGMELTPVQGWVGAELIPETRAGGSRPPMGSFRVVAGVSGPSRGSVGLL